MNLIFFAKSIVSKLIRPNDLPSDFWQLRNGQLSSRSATALKIRYLLWKLLSAATAVSRIPHYVFIACAVVAERDRLWLKPLSRMKKGQGCVVDSSVWLMNGRSIVFGNNVKVSSGSALLAGDKARIILGDDVLVGPNTLIVAMNHGYRSRAIPKRLQPWVDEEAMSIHIGSNVWLGGGVVILPGTRIGAGAVIAAGSVVRGVVKENCLYRQPRAEVSSLIEMLD